MSNLKKGLSLCVIVGPGEAFELDRLLASCTPGGKEPLFDDLCITHATTKVDEDVVAVIKKYTENVSHFDWVVVILLKAISCTHRDWPAEWPNLSHKRPANLSELH